MEQKQKRKVLKVVLAGVLVLFTAGIIFGIWFSSHYKSMVKNKLPEWVAKATDSLYHVQVRDVSISFFTDRITITDAKLWPDSNRLKQLRSEGNLPKTVFTFESQKIEAKDISWTSLIAEKAFSAGRFIINEPHILVTAVPPHLTDVPEKKERKRARIQKIAADYIEIRQPTVIYQNHTTPDSTTSYIKGGDIVLTDWLYDPQSKDYKEQVMYGKLGRLAMDSFYYATSTGMYSISTGNVSVSDKDKSVSVKNFRLASRYDRETFYKIHGYQKDIFDIAFPSIVIKDFDPEALINENTLKATAVDLDNPSIQLYFSRIPPPDGKSKMGNFPNQLVQKAAMHIYVNKINISKGHFRYTELNPATMLEGTFFIDSVNGTATNITNMPQYTTRNKDAHVSLRGRFMDASIMQATFTLDMVDTAGAFAVEGTHTGLKAQEVQEMTKALAVVNIKSLDINKIAFKVQGNQYAATGSMTMQYKDLSVQLLKADEDKELKNQGLVSFVANHALLYDSNPADSGALRSVAMSIERKPTGSFFNLIWKCLYEGILKSTLRNNDAAEMLVNRDAEEQRKKKEVFKKLGELFRVGKEK